MSLLLWALFFGCLGNNGSWLSFSTVSPVLPIHWRWTYDTHFRVDNGPPKTMVWSTCCLDTAGQTESGQLEKKLSNPHWTCVNRWGADFITIVAMACHCHCEGSTARIDFNLLTQICGCKGGRVNDARS